MTYSVRTGLAPVRMGILEMRLSFPQRTTSTISTLQGRGQAPPIQVTETVHYHN